MEKENWINGILNSADGIKKAVPNAALFSKIEMQIIENQFVSSRMVWIAAASILILVAVNVTLVKRSAHAEAANPTTSIASSFDQSYQLYQ